MGALPPPPSSVPLPFDGAAAATLPPGQSPNPAYRQLYQAYQSAYGSIDELRRALDSPVKTLNGTDAWLGPEARQWGDQLEDGRRRLRSAADRILWDIYTALSATDRVVGIAG
ncbi:hypothetical protein DPM19_21525 [Actinomadura craniellae]|uniref:Uncharacterized protein n=1 Tax=Actinomadura craniellae TaxID=2231787 RepID=A0A365H1V2_9ACTN|nr:hypothetical protein [Actinomadura craniellae]RAY13081.1 hypothetical protein DPM19_21525 [Actinomadura craniellae]